MHEDSTREVGKFDNPIYGASQLKGKTEAQILDLKNKEIENGRLAMFGKNEFLHILNLCLNYNFRFYSLPCIQLPILAIGGLVHHTIIAGTETFGSFPNTDLWGQANGAWSLF